MLSEISSSVPVSAFARETSRKSSSQSTSSSRRKNDPNRIGREARGLVAEIVASVDRVTTFAISRDGEELGVVRLDKRPHISRSWRCEICGRAVVVPWSSKGCGHILAASVALIAYDKAHPQLYDPDGR